MPVVRQSVVPARIIDVSCRARQLGSGMFRLVTAVAAVLLSALRARRELLFENLSLRQQLATLVQKDRPRIMTADRVFWVILRLYLAKTLSVCACKPVNAAGTGEAGLARARGVWNGRPRRGSTKDSVVRSPREIGGATG